MPKAGSWAARWFLNTVDKVDLLFGGYPGTAARAVMPLAEKHKYVYVSMGGHMKSFQQGYTYSFGGPPTNVPNVRPSIA
jgi:branched-chain amino acid transport system substrate-binding protein